MQAAGSFWSVTSHGLYRAQTAGASLRMVLTRPRFAAVTFSGLALTTTGLAHLSPEASGKPWSCGFLPCCAALRRPLPSATAIQMLVWDHFCGTGCKEIACLWSVW